MFDKRILLHGLLIAALAACSSSNKADRQDAEISAERVDVDSAHIEEVQNELAETRSALRRAQEQVLVHERSIATLRAQLTTATSERDRIQAALDQAMEDVSANDGEIARLRMELQTAITERDRLRSEVTALESTAAGSQTEVRGLTAEVERLRAEVRNLRAQVAELTPPADPEYSLERTGTYASSSSQISQIVNGVSTRVTRQSVQIGNYGFWGKKDDETLFRAYFNASGTVTNGVPRQSFSSAVTGSRSGSNPVSGSAVWSGQTRAVNGTFLRVQGRSTLTYDFNSETVDLEFTEFDDGSAAVSWNDLAVTAGAFRGSALSRTVEGAFYGTEHEGAAGEFAHGDLRGVFGALRE